MQPSCAILVVTYHLNGDYLPRADAKPSAYLTANFLSTGRLSFTPADTPYMFIWKGVTAEGRKPIAVNSWKQVLGGGGGGGGGAKTLDDWRKSGQIQMVDPAHYIIPSVRPGEYISAYGAATGLAALPVMAVVSLLHPDAVKDSSAIWGGIKLATSLMTALTAVFAFLAARHFTSSARSVLVAMVYGLGNLSVECRKPEPLAAYTQCTIPVGGNLFPASHRPIGAVSILGRGGIVGGLCLPSDQRDGPAGGRHLPGDPQ